MRFDPTARRAIDLAMVEAERRGQPSLDSLHLLFGLLDAGGNVGNLLKGLDLDAARLREIVDRALGTGDPDAPDVGIEVASATEEILQVASNISRDRGAAQVVDIDILCALIERGDTAAARLLLGFGLRASDVRHELGANRPLRGSTGTPAEPIGPVAPRISARVGIGYDSHRLVAGGPLRLGGVNVPHDRHLSGHSDGDAVAHALTDAILGAAGLGDIGEMFADTDPANRGRDSIEMLRLAAGRVRASGWAVSQADVTVIAERPALAPHREAMRRALGDALGVTPDRIGLKAKSNEGMGWIGRGEGIACMAVAMLVPAGG